MSIKYKTTFFFKKSNVNAILPTQEQGDVGYDLYASESAILYPGEVTKVNTGIQFAKDPIFLDDDGQPFSMLLKMEGRSGMASKGIWPVGGIIDPSYRNDLLVCLFNSTKQTYEIKQGNRIAQLVAYPVIAKSNSHIIEVKEVDWQTNSKRGTRGFGSSGS